MEVVVLGIDPGTANTGYGVVLAHGQRLAALDGGVIATEPSEPLERRLARIHTRVLDLIREHAPVALAIEDLYFGQNARSAFQVGQARGAVLLCGGLAGIPAYSYTQQVVKQAGWGSGAAGEGPGQGGGAGRDPGLLVHAAGGQTGGLRLGRRGEGPGAADGREPAGAARAAAPRPRGRRPGGSDLPRQRCPDEGGGRMIASVRGTVTVRRP